MALTLATELADYAAGIGTQGATLKIDSANKRVGVGTTNPQGPEGSLQVGTGITFFGNTGIISAIGGKFSGDFTVGGTLTYEDVQNVNSSGVGTFSGGINIVGGGLTVTGVSTFFSALDVNSTADFAGPISVGDTISLGDHDRLRFGAGNDLQIYHDATDSYVDNDEGDLYIRNTGDDIIIRAADDVLIQTQGSEGAIVARGDGVVELYYDNSKKLETTSAGIKVSGSFPDIIIHDTDTTNDNFRILHNGGGTQLLVDPNNVGPNASYLIVGIDGTERLRVDNNGLVGINTTAPESQLTVKGDGVIGAKAFKYNYTTDHGIQVKGNESAIDIVATDGGNHGSSLLLRSSLDGFGMFFDPTRDQLRFMYTVPSADNFSIHDGSNTSTNTEALIIGKTGICTATQLFEGTTRVATGGKAIAMALIFG